MLHRGRLRAGRHLTGPTTRRRGTRPRKARLRPPSPPRRTPSRSVVPTKLVAARTRLGPIPSSSPTTVTSSVPQLPWLLVQRLRLLRQLLPVARPPRAVGPPDLRLPARLPPVLAGAGPFRTGASTAASRGIEPIGARIAPPTRLALVAAGVEGAALEAEEEALAVVPLELLPPPAQFVVPPPSAPSRPRSLRPAVRSSPPPATSLEASSSRPPPTSRGR